MLLLRLFDHLLTWPFGYAAAWRGAPKNDLMLPFIWQIDFSLNDTSLPVDSNSPPMIKNKLVEVQGFEPWSGLTSSSKSSKSICAAVRIRTFILGFGDRHSAN